jgi:hypothetical protein
MYVFVVLALCVPVPCRAQILVGHVVDSATWARVAPATVTLLDSASLVVSEVAADSSGYFELEAAAGHYRLRVESPGYRPFVTDLFELRPDQRVAYEIALAPDRRPFVAGNAMARLRRTCRAAAQLPGSECET